METEGKVNDSGETEEINMCPHPPLTESKAGPYSTTVITKFGICFQMLQMQVLSCKKGHTVAGPIIETPFSLAIFNSFRVRFSGIPSAMMAIVLI